jgi:hypothetical protein
MDALDVIRPDEADEVSLRVGEEEARVSPLRAARRHCLWCCNGSSNEVSLCTVKRRALWTSRFGRRPTAELRAEQGSVVLHPEELGIKSDEFDGSALRAIRLRCIDCSSGSRKAVTNCKSTDCDLFPFRLGKNPNFGSMSDETRAKIGLPPRRPE